MIQFTSIRPFRTAARAAAILLAINCLCALPAWAQFGNAGDALQAGRRSRGQPAPPPVIQPPALPGVKGNPTGVAPAARLPTDMAPTDALFDSINRGDIAVARDAIARGADLSAHNLLGLTPTELAVDLGRTDISVLLLSLRAETARGAAQGAVEPAKRPVVERKPPSVRATAAPPPAPTTPRLFANDGGAPVPSVGFLGFDAGRTLR
jgi:hypothetical protein